MSAIYHIANDWTNTNRIAGSAGDCAYILATIFEPAADYEIAIGDVGSNWGFADLLDAVANGEMRGCMGTPYSTVRVSSTVEHGPYDHDDADETLVVTVWHDGSLRATKLAGRIVGALAARRPSATVVVTSPEPEVAAKTAGVDLVRDAAEDIVARGK